MPHRQILHRMKCGDITNNIDDSDGLSVNILTVNHLQFFSSVTGDGDHATANVPP